MVSPTGTPLVSVVLPTCDRRSILTDCLEALARQTYPRLEIVVVDDCSSDGTMDLLRYFAACHPTLELRSFRNDRHLGANPSRNRGICEAHGDFVAFLDSDCLAEPDWLARLMAGFTSARVAAVSGLVIEPPPRNIYELTFKGTHRLHHAGPTRRLIAGNMCVRRELLIKHRLDEDRAPATVDQRGRPDIAVSGRGDEEGLSLRLRSAGHELRFVPDAIALHDHPLTGRTFARQALRGGRSAAGLVYKYYLPQRPDMLPFLMAYLTLPLVLVRACLVLVPSCLFVGALAAITYNDLVRKGKTLLETICSFPVLLIYYHLRLTGYVWESLRLRLTRHALQRVCLRDLPSDYPEVIPGRAEQDPKEPVV